jgi:predicted RNase H-like HicB family nuclease
MQIPFNVSPCAETGGYVARWDDPSGGGICTQGHSFSDLEFMVRDAVEGYFADQEKPRRIQLHFVEDKSFNDTA